MADDGDEILDQYYGPPAPRQSPWQVGKGLADAWAGEGLRIAGGILKAPYDAAKNILGRGPVQISSGESHEQGPNIGEDAFQAGSVALAGTPFAPEGAVGAGGGRLPKLPMDKASRMARAAEQGDSGKDWYHGSNRIDRVVEKGKLDPKRATSGPMPFFTDDPEMASNYAKNKPDTSRMRDDPGDSVANYFQVSPKDLYGDSRARTPYTVEQSWHGLPQETKAEILDRWHRIGYENRDNAMGPYTLHDEPYSGLAGKDHYDWTLKTEARGNPLTALRNIWHDGGQLIGSEHELADIFKLAGYPHPISQANAPWTEAMGVLPARLKMQNPLRSSDTETIKNKVIPALEEAFKRDRTRNKPQEADMWDKNHRWTPKQWLEQLKQDTAEGVNGYVWTSIPDKVTAELKKLGYDAIIDMGGKGGGKGHEVAIPFEPHQVRSPNAKFDPAKQYDPNLLAGIAGAAAIPTTAEILQQYYGDQNHARGGKVRRKHYGDGGGDGSGDGSGSDGGNGDGGGATGAGDGSEGSDGVSGGSDGSMGGMGPGESYGDAGTSVSSSESYGGQEGNDAGMGAGYGSETGYGMAGSDTGASNAAASAMGGFGMGDSMGAMGTSVSGPDSMDAGVAAANAAASYGANNSGFGMGATGFGPGQANTGNDNSEAEAAVANAVDAMGVYGAGVSGFGYGFGQEAPTSVASPSAVGPTAAAVEASPGPGPAMASPGPVGAPGPAPGPSAPGPAPGPAVAAVGQPGPMGPGPASSPGGAIGPSGPFGPVADFSGDPRLVGPNDWRFGPTFSKVPTTFAQGGAILEQYYGGGAAPFAEDPDFKRAGEGLDVLQNAVPPGVPTDPNYKYGWSIHDAIKWPVAVGHAMGQAYLPSISVKQQELMDRMGDRNVNSVRDLLPALGRAGYTPRNEPNENGEDRTKRSFWDYFK